MRIAVLGANGQVGAEVCLLLARQPDVTLIPVCRNRLGSAFLRYSGLACRHGTPADDHKARELIGDCDVVANFALGSGSLREAHDANIQLIRNSIDCSPPRARIVFFSTVTVYGDPSPTAKRRWKNAYAREKLRCESFAVQHGRTARKDVFVLRLGHVCGELQNITGMIRETVFAGPVHVPSPERHSNTTHVATIADAILKCGRGLDAPGVYDLLNVPQWTWRDVVEYEASVVSVEPQIIATGAADNGKPSLKSRVLQTAIRTLTGSTKRKERAMQLIARLSPRWNRKIQASYYRNRAAAEIAALHGTGQPNEAMMWRAVGWRFLTSLARTRDLLDSELFRAAPWDAASAWPADLPKAEHSNT